MAYAVECRYCGQRVVTAGRIGDPELAAMREHPRTCPKGQWRVDDPPTIEALLRHFDVRLWPPERG